MQTPSDAFETKVGSIIIVFCLFIGVIMLRLYYLQVRHNQVLFLLSQKNFTRVEKIKSPRGNILDCKGRLLATNRPVNNLYWHGTQKPQLDDEHLALIEQLNQILEMELSPAAIKSAEKHGRELLLATDITFEQLSKIAEQISDSPNIKISTHFIRHYPYHELASHIVGYLGQVDYEPIGKMGLEKLLEENLRGQEGELVKVINSLGKNLSEKELKRALAGQDITTTIDLSLQELVERLFPSEQAGTMFIMDPKNGALRALVSRPNFDPNIFLQPIDSEQWQKLQEGKAFINRAFGASYPPASIFKLVTISAAIEKGIVDPESTVKCRGFYWFGSYKHMCNEHNGHGVLSVKQAVAKSCNILFYHIGKHISIDTLADYAHRFGLGKKTNIIFPELEGLIPTTQWKKETKGERWWPGETLSAAIGQSYLLVTPIQIGRMISSIFEGYLVTPRILEQEPIETEPLNISKQMLEFLRQSMRAVVNMGTGIRLSYLKDMEIYAKTGTAQISSLALRENNEKYAEHAWIVLYFRYKNFDPLTAFILIEHASTSKVATAVGKEFLMEYKKLLSDTHA